MRLIINNEANLSDTLSMQVVQAVIANGKISANEKCYCYLTTFKNPSCMVFCKLTKKGYSFTISLDTTSLFNNK